MQRNILGILALAILATSAFLWLTEAPAAGYPILQGILWRVGAVLGVWWLAYPDLRRLPVWVMVSVPVLIVVLARWPKLLLAALVVLVILALLKPRLAGKGPRG